MNGITLQNANGGTLTVQYSGTATGDRVLTLPEITDTIASNTEVIGVGQTWQDMTVSRVINTTYTNTTGKPIMINVTTTSTTAGAAGLGVVAGLTMYFGAYPAGYYINVTLIVPVGATYTASNNGASPTLFKWYELR